MRTIIWILIYLALSGAAQHNGQMMGKGIPIRCLGLPATPTSPGGCGPQGGAGGK